MVDDDGRPEQGRGQQQSSDGGRYSRSQFLSRAAAGGAALAGTSFLVAACGSDGGGGATSSAGTAATKRRGGVLRVGLSGGTSTENLDANSPTSQTACARVMNLFDPLGAQDHSAKLRLALAEEMTPSADAKEWTIRLKDGLEFHNGKTVTADDVIFTIQRIINPKDPKNQAAALDRVDPNGMKKLDARTVRLTLRQPNAVLDQVLSIFATGIVPVGYDPTKPVGAGPFKFKSFKPGEQSTFVRFENYWGEGPFVDELVLININDDTARVNALISGQVHAVDAVPAAQQRLISSSSDAQILLSQTGAWRPFTMRVDAPPFDDVNVRQAMRLLVDRRQMIEQALDGKGRVASDLFSPDDPCFASDLTRDVDIEQAKSLLAKAGASDLRVELNTAPIAGGLVEASQVLAEQAKAAGVTVKVNKLDPSTLFGDNYNKWLFSVDYFPNQPYMFQLTSCQLPKSPYNVTHWSDREFLDLYETALAQVDESQRCKTIHEMQRIQFDRGGYIVWGYPDNIDAYSTKVTGLVPDRTGWNLSRYGFKEVSLTA